MAPMIHKLEQFTGMGSDWMGFARSMNRDATMQRSPREYWESNFHAGLSPFNPVMSPIEDLGRDGSAAELLDSAEFFISGDKAMFGVDYPHFESNLPSLEPTLAELVGHPAISEAQAQKILFENAADVYGFDRAVLQPHVDRIGFELSEVLVTSSA
jgi:predicted TIM-barrel fold metal-dependent hydrolase